MKQKATFACGCFWCSEAIFKGLKGVEKVAPGYSGVGKPNPTYEEVSTGQSGHAEAIQITFDPKIISYKDLVYVFFRTHDPTSINRQGADLGPQYRSTIFFHDEKQRQVAQEELTKAQQGLEGKIVTEIVLFESFYPAEPFHQDYYAKNRGATYCKVVIDPKIQKLKRDFKTFLK